MRILLDTHAFLWFATEPSRISSQLQTILVDTESSLFLSAASIWEIGIKVAVGKLTLLEPIEQLVGRQLDVNELQILPIQIAHVTAMMKLPLHHRDPFDRLLIGQCIAENLTLVTSDDLLAQYPVKQLWIP